MDIAPGIDMNNFYMRQWAAFSKSDYTKLCLKLFKNIISAIRYLHSIGIVHRDIKLSNIIYDQKNETCKIIDFGFAVAKDIGNRPQERSDINNKDINNFVGSAAYISPAILAYKNNPDRYSFELWKYQDLWAACVVLYNFAHNRHPYYVDIRRPVNEYFSNIINRKTAYRRSQSPEGTYEFLLDKLFSGDTDDVDKIIDDIILLLEP